MTRGSFSAIFFSILLNSVAIFLCLNSGHKEPLLSTNFPIEVERQSQAKSGDKLFTCGNRRKQLPVCE